MSDTKQEMVEDIREIRGEDCAILRLVLKGKWYDMIAHGDKRQEYRDYTQYWKTRIDRWVDERKRGKLLVVGFSRGYRNADLFFNTWKIPVVVSKGAVFAEWGEPPTPHFAIYLDKRVYPKWAVPPEGWK